MQWAAEIVRRRRAFVSLDVNHRSTALVPGGGPRRAVRPRRNGSAGDRLGRRARPRHLPATARTPRPPASWRRGVQQVVVKRGAAGASACTPPTAGWTCPPSPVTVVDPIGAGDAFTAGYLSALLDGATPRAACERAVTAGAFAVTTRATGRAPAGRARPARTRGNPR